MGGFAFVRSGYTTASCESFHPWLSSPPGAIFSYSTYPSPSRSPYRSIHSSASSAFGQSSRTASSSPVHQDPRELDVRGPEARALLAPPGVVALQHPPRVLERLALRPVLPRLRHDLHADLRGLPRLERQLEHSPVLLDLTRLRREPQCRG